MGGACWKRRSWKQISRARRCQPAWRLPRLCQFRLGLGRDVRRSKGSRAIGQSRLWCRTESRTNPSNWKIVLRRLCDSGVEVDGSSWILGGKSWRSQDWHPKGALQDEDRVRGCRGRWLRQSRLDCVFRVSLACSKGYDESWDTSREWRLRRRVSRLNILFKRGNKKSENTYRGRHWRWHKELWTVYCLAKGRYGGDSCSRRGILECCRCQWLDQPTNWRPPADALVHSQLWRRGCPLELEKC